MYAQPSFSGDEKEIYDPIRAYPKLK